MMSVAQRRERQNQNLESSTLFFPTHPANAAQSGAPTAWKCETKPKWERMGHPPTTALPESELKRKSVRSLAWARLRLGAALDLNLGNVVERHRIPEPVVDHNCHPAPTERKKSCTYRPGW